MNRKELLEAIQVAAQADDMDEYNRLQDLMKKKVKRKTQLELEADKLGVTPLDLALSRIEDANYER